MRQNRHSELDAELAEIFALEREYSSPPESVRARVWERVQSVALTTAALGGVAAGAALATGAAHATMLSVSLTTKLVRVALVFAVGAGVGIGVDRVVVATQAPSPSVAHRRSALQPAPHITPVEVDRMETTSITPVQPAHIRSSPPSHAPSSSRERATPTRERTIVDIARTAMARNRYDAARDALRQHEHQFPRGSLVEEREALKVFLAVRTETPELARQSARRFRARYPHSLFLGPIEASLSPP